MNVRYWLLLWLLFGVFAANGQARYKLTGQVVDAQTSAALSYATVRVFRSADSSLVGGTISDEKGGFVVQLTLGQYYALVEFVGYKPLKTSGFSVGKDTPIINLGVLKVKASTKTLNEVEVRAEKSTMVLSLDKRVFNVGKDLANAGGSASDLLTNIPSVSVDPDGSVKLRGSDNVRILIDGKPSGLVSFKGGAGLQQLQGSMVERVEVITNPSARYEAEGMAGIINIILKKDQQQGFNGSLELITGYPINYGLGGNLNYRHKKVNFFINYGLAYRIQPSVGTLFQEVYDGGTTYFSQQDRKGKLKGINNNIRGGLDYFFSESSILTASYLLRRSDAHRLTDLTYIDYAGTLTNRVRTTYRNQDEREKEPNSEYALSYKKDFARKNHTFSAEVRFLDNWESSNQLFTQNAFLPNGSPDLPQTIVQNSLNDEYEKQWLLQADYVQPLGKEGKFETGVRSSFRDMVNDYVVNQKNEAGVFVPIAGLKNYFIYNEVIHALYGILGNKSKRFSYQAGLRAEWTDVKTTLRETNQVNPRQYANLFPSVHITYDLPHENALQLSYSRRVRRPFYNDLSPFATFSDNRNFFGGNPDLDPEFSNVYELGHIKYFDKGSLSSSVYFRDTQDKIQTIRTVNADGFSITRPENLRSERSVGVELTSQYAPYKWWKMDYNFNLFHAQIDGSNISDTYQRQTLSWFVRHTSRFSLPKSLDIQLRGNYEAPQVTAQGKQLYMFFIDLSMSKDVMKGKGTLNLNVMDVFNSRIRRFNAEGPNFYSVGSSQFRMRQINLTLNLRLNQAKNAKRAKSLINEEGA